LLHDAAEAYIGDLPGPLKAFLPDYRAVETVMMGAIADRFGLAVGYEFVVKECDRACEKLELMAMSGEEVGIRFLDSRSAKALFIERFEQWSRV
jgi:5'-deoxynucleotidase YfbR-like HD superfamily hydrolase